MMAQAEANRSRLRGDGDAAAKHQGRADQYEQQADDQLQQTPLVEIALGEVVRPLASTYAIRSPPPTRPRSMQTNTGSTCEPPQVSVPAGDLPKRREALSQVEDRFGLPALAPVALRTDGTALAQRCCVGNQTTVTCV